MYKVYGRPFTRTFRVLWALEEMGRPYELIETSPHSDVVLERNISGKVPVLEVDGEYITDSTAIMTFLADRHGLLAYSAGTLARAKQDSVTQMLLDELDAVLWTAARHSFILPEEWRRPQVKDSLNWEFTRNLDRIAGQLKTPFLMGDEMTLPDIILVHCLNWARSAKFDVTQDVVVEYADRLRDRPAFKRVTDLAKP
ncbi:MAG: glutathione S-transferase family protein [Paracoccaceae bacterium]|jgi:glutathione S-transferase